MPSQPQGRRAGRAGARGGGVGGRRLVGGARRGFLLADSALPQPSPRSLQGQVGELREARRGHHPASRVPGFPAGRAPLSVLTRVWQQGALPKRPALSLLGWGPVLSMARGEREGSLRGNAGDRPAPPERHPCRLRLSTEPLPSLHPRGSRSWASSPAGPWNTSGIHNRLLEQLRGGQGSKDGAAILWVYVENWLPVSYVPYYLPCPEIFTMKLQYKGEKPFQPVARSQYPQPKLLEQRHIYQPLNLTIGLTMFAVGKYTSFVQPFLESAEQFFMQGYWVCYYIFTDDPTAIPRVPLGPGRRLSVLHIQKYSRWEEISTRRMETISQHIAETAHREVDYIFSVAVDMLHFKHPYVKDGPPFLWL
ncbi:hypothetical protein MC885_007081 [Smutsia gigantea]|nr:hypothetical protein MC885_007081 [Smutsia gigantea]